MNTYTVYFIQYMKYIFSLHIKGKKEIHVYFLLFGVWLWVLVLRIFYKIYLKY